MGGCTLAADEGMKRVMMSEAITFMAWSFGLYKLWTTKVSGLRYDEDDFKKIRFQRNWWDLVMQENDKLIDKVEAELLAAFHHKKEKEGELGNLLVPGVPSNSLMTPAAVKKYCLAQNIREARILLLG